MSLQKPPTETRVKSFGRYYGRLIKYILRDSFLTFSKDQIVGIVLVILILFYQVKAGLIPQDQTWANALTVIKPYLWVLGGYVAWHTVRAPWFLDEERKEEIARIEQRAIDAVERQPPTIKRGQEKLETNIVYMRGETTIAHVQERGGATVQGEYQHVSRSLTTNAADRNFLALVAVFLNKPIPERTIGGWGSISARLTYSSPEWAAPIEISRGAWLAEEDSRVIFGVNDTHRLIIAIAYGKQPYIHAVQRDSRGSRAGIDNRTTEIKGHSCFVNVQLIFEIDGSIIREFKFKLTIGREPEFNFYLELLEPLSIKDIREKLSAFMNEGHILIERLQAAHVASIYEGDIQAWLNRTEEFLATLDGSYVTRFRHPPLKPYPYESYRNVRKWVDKLYAQTSQLEEFIKEYR